MSDQYASLTDRLRAVLPNSSAARDAVNLVELLLEALDPPANFAALSVLLNALTAIPGEPKASAQAWRDAASQVCELCEYTSAGQMLELALYEHALVLDPRPAWQMFSVSQHLMFAGLQPVQLAAVLPSIDFDRATSNAFDVAHARLVIADRVRSVCMDAAHAARSLRRFADWSIDDLECALLAIRMSYTVFRRRMDGLESTPRQLRCDFHENWVPIWRRIILQLDSIDIDRHLQRLPQSTAWREYLPWAVEWYLYSLADANEAGVRAGVDAYCRERGFA
ncbi:MAG: hypothetical protein ABI702_00435 [Burkholderiales bacterium]